MSIAAGSSGARAFGGSPRPGNVTRSKRRAATIRPLPLLSMIDVMMCCLFFFVAAGSLNPAESELRSTLAGEASPAGQGQDLQTQLVHVERSPLGRVQFRVGSWRLESKGDLTRVLEKLPKPPGIVIRVRGDVPVEAAAAALQAATDAGFVRVSYVPGKA
ncbi:MAG: biopolymer transporter ExbD [Planctomycetota bacterium]|nr:biopolymer transporter ExbD [Planctomycetota bacterium]